MFDFPRSLPEFQRRFPDERACAASGGCPLAGRLQVSGLRS